MPTRTPSVKRKQQPRKDPAGGLTAAGRAYFARKEGSHLRPGVQGPADTPLTQRRKGSFLRRHFAHLRGPLVDENGNPTRLALSAHAWGEAVPKTKAAAAKLARKGARLLERYQASKGKKSSPAKKRAAKTSQTKKRRAAQTQSRKRKSVSAHA